MNARTTPTPLLTATDRHTVTQVRALCEISGPDAVREHTGETDTGMAYACAFGEARELLARAADIIERLGGDAKSLSEL